MLFNEPSNIHFQMKKLISSLLLALFFATVLSAADNALSKSEKADGWKLLFNGKNLNDWKIDKWNPESISVKDGAIKCHGKPSMVYYTGKDKEMTDFHFKADVMTKPGSNGGIFFHTQYQDKGWPVGHEAQINQTQKDPVKTGSVYIVKKHLEAPAKDNEWFHYEIIVKGKRVETKVDGKTVVVYNESKDVKGTRKLSKGTIGLQAHDPGSTVLVKNIKVKSL